MTGHQDNNLGMLAPFRMLITFTLAGLASASSVGLVAIIDTWWILVVAVLFLLAAGGVVQAVISRELSRDDGPEPR
jgi:hypothetical protein